MRINLQTRLTFLAGLVALPSCFSSAVPTSYTGTCDSGVEFSISVNDPTYTVGTRVRVTAIVKNTGETPLYLFRDIGQCSSQIGSYSVALFDSKSKFVPTQGCSADMVMDSFDAVQELTNPRTGIALEHGEVYGREIGLELPTKKGTYQLRAQIEPAGLNRSQKELLERGNKRIIKNSCQAPVLTVKVR